MTDTPSPQAVRVVPVEPTEAMVLAGETAMEREAERGPLWQLKYAWSAMLAASPALAAETVVLKGVGKINGDGWKDTTQIGEVVFVWNAEKPAPYGPGQYPRVGNEGWSASTTQYDFTPATVEEVQQLFSALAAETGGEAVAKVVRKGFSTGSIVHTRYGEDADLPDGTLLYAALSPAPEDKEAGR